MRISEVEYRPYRIPFKAPFATSSGVEHARRGVVLRVTTDTGVTGLGEATALPSFGTGTFEDSQRHLNQLGDDIRGQSVEDTWRLLNRYADDPKWAPACFALDTALYDILAQQAELPISQYLRPDSAATVPVNATISDTDTERAASAASYATMAGYQTIKMKAGLLSDLDAEVARIAAVREAVGPHTEIRVDANGSWTYQQAMEIGNRLAPLGIAYLEQPLHPRDIRGMAKLREAIKIPIAADEAATTKQAVERIIQLDAADVVVLKPGVVGGLRRSRELVEFAERSGVRVVVTTAIEAGIATTAALHLAATLTHPIPACGLATGTLLEDDLLVSSLRITGGEMKVPTRPGLGVELSRERSDRMRE